MIGADGLEDGLVAVALIAECIECQDDHLDVVIDVLYFEASINRMQQRTQNIEEDVGPAGLQSLPRD